MPYTSYNMQKIKYFDKKFKQIQIRFKFFFYKNRFLKIQNNSLNIIIFKKQDEYHNIKIVVDNVKY